MLTLILFVILILLIVLERKGKINLSNMGGSVFMMLSVSALMGLYVVEFVRAILAICIKSFILKEEDIKKLIGFIGKGLENSSSVAIVLRMVLLFILFIPFAAGVIYVVQKMVKSPLKINSAETTDEYRKRCALRLCTLGIIACCVFFAAGIAMILCIIPCVDNLVESLMLFHPLVLLFMIVFTAGIGVIFILLYAAILNAALFTAVTAFGLVCFALYGFTVIFAFSSLYRAKKIGALTTSQVVSYGIFSLLMGWNIIPVIMLRKKINNFTVKDNVVDFN